MGKNGRAGELRHFGTLLSPAGKQRKVLQFGEKMLCFSPYG
jgi:hypothetical protein